MLATNFRLSTSKIKSDKLLILFNTGELKPSTALKAEPTVFVCDYLVLFDLHHHFIHVLVLHLALEVPFKHLLILVDDVHHIVELVHIIATSRQRAATLPEFVLRQTGLVFPQL